jgi:hypothetical protein
MEEQHGDFAHGVSAEELKSISPRHQRDRTDLKTATTTARRTHDGFGKYGT